MSLKILGRVSSINVRKVLWTCEALQLPFVREDWGIGFKPTSNPEFQTLNPNSLIPVLLDGDFVLWESNTIIRYLANRYQGEMIYPSEAQARARVDQWIDWQASDLNPSWSYTFMALMRQSPNHKNADEIKKSTDLWNKHMRTLNQQLLRTKAFIVGESFSLADIPIALSVHRWLATSIDHPPLPAVNDYMERLKSHSGFKAYCRAELP